MSIEQVQVLLGYSQIDITLRYAIVNQNNVQIPSLIKHFRKNALTVNYSWKLKI